MKAKSFLVMGALVMSSAVLAADHAEFRIDNGAGVSFSYDLDSGAAKVTGELTRNGTSPVEIVGDRLGNWNGRVGTVSVSVAVAEVQADGSRTIEVQTMDGIYDYTLE